METYDQLLPAHHLMHVLSGFTSPLPCSSAHVIKLHFGALHVSRWLSCCIFCAISKAMLSHRSFLMPELKAGRKVKSMFSHLRSINLNLSFLYPWGNILFLPHSSFCLHTLMSFFLSSLHTPSLLLLS